MEISPRYNPATVEDKWYSRWMQNGLFRSVPDEREPYTIVIPPPNVTGVLHMGHVLNNTIQDILVRRARMLGKNACWVPGTDHASIATEARVVAMLREKGIKKSDLTRDEFLKYAWEWKEKYGGIILEQLKKLGCSCDWERTRFTMEKSLSDGVIHVFTDLYNKGYIYRGHRMINWDPSARTALSDEEVNYKEVNSKLYYVKYKIADADEYIIVATTRPETILGDTGLCVNPKDGRYAHLREKSVIVPVVNRKVPVIFDEYVDMEFGTGALKVTPAHDLADYELGKKHKLEIIDILNEDGTLNKFSQFYDGMDRFAARKKIVEDLEKTGQIEKIENFINKVGYSERTDVPIEPRLSLQWFLRMNKLSKPALENILNGNIKLIPGKFINSYRHWMENVHDWCISRQLWWGHRIPAWYCGCEECPDVVIVQQEKPRECPRCKCTKHLRQDEDVLDTWFSSWLWPVSVFDGFKDPGKKDMTYYYPTNDLVTAPEILFFWVARMIMAGYEYLHEKPFSNVYLTGTVRDKQGRKMSKSLGNSPEPLDLINKYGADGVRLGMMLCSPAGNDLLFDESLCEQGRNFCNKIWNAFRLVMSWKKSPHADIAVRKSGKDEIAVIWFESRLNSAIHEINDHFSKFRISDALMSAYKLVWDDFCSVYLEIIKPDRGEVIDEEIYQKTLDFFETQLILLHPFIPFVTEEIWHLISEENRLDSIMQSDWPEPAEYSDEVLSGFEFALQVVSAVRNFRSEKNISSAAPVRLLTPDHKSPILPYADVIKKLCGLSEAAFCADIPDDSSAIVVRSVKLHLLSPESINQQDEKLKVEKELAYTRGFLESVERKLANPKFVQNAAETILEKERKKKSDAEERIKLLEEQLASLG
ncbi:MAG: valine--tRNA ligase [Bacteroidetes bacterium]|nr:valine--tRNA ligase [Bacteroidota bacterium]